MYQNKKENFEFRNKKSRYRNSKIYFYIKDRVIWTWSAITYDHWQNHEPGSLTIMIARVKQIWATFTHDRQWSWMIADHIQITLSLSITKYSLIEWPVFFFHLHTLNQNPGHSIEFHIIWLFMHNYYIHFEIISPNRNKTPLKMCVILLLGEKEWIAILLKLNLQICESPLPGNSWIFTRKSCT